MMTVRFFVPCEALWRRWDLSVDVARFAIEAVPFHFDPQTPTWMGPPLARQVVLLMLARIEFDPHESGRHDAEVHVMPPSGPLQLVSQPFVLPQIPADGRWRLAIPVAFTPTIPGPYRLELRVDHRPQADWPLEVIPLPLPPGLPGTGASAAGP